MMKKLFPLFLQVFFIFLGATSFAGGPLYVTESGEASVWDTSSAIKLHPETGACGPFTNAQAIQKIQDAIDQWTGQDEISLSASITTGSLSGVDICNYGDYLVSVSGASGEGLTDELNPVLFDNDGEIIAAVAGSSNKLFVLGFANPSGFSSDLSEIVDGQAVFNCLCLSGNPFAAEECVSGSDTIEFTENELDSVILHEMGHFFNVDHSQANADVIDTSDTGDDTHLTTMYPIIQIPDGQTDLTRDDIIALASIYPSGNLTANNCLVTGTLLDSSGNPLRCADVQATTSDSADTVAFVSGALAVNSDGNGDGDSDDDGECLSGCGDFRLYLEPGKSYTLTVKPVDSRFTGGSSLSPCVESQLTTIEEEDIAAISASCTAGATVAFGNITTTSTGGISPAVSAALSPGFSMNREIQSAVSSTQTSPSFQTSCPESSSSGGSSCELSHQNTETHLFIYFIILTIIFIFITVRYHAIKKSTCHKNQ